MKRVGVIDYGTGNLRSVVKAFECTGAKVYIINEPVEFTDIDALVFPGQGTYDQCMGSLVGTGLDKFIIKWIEADKPYFGICLGLQVLFPSSEEVQVPGLGLVDGKVKRAKQYCYDSAGAFYDWDGTVVRAAESHGVDL